MTRTASLHHFMIQYGTEPGTHRYKNGLVEISADVMADWQRDGHRTPLVIEEREEKPGAWVAKGLKGK